MREDLQPRTRGICLAVMLAITLALLTPVAARAHADTPRRDLRVAQRYRRYRAARWRRRRRVASVIPRFPELYIAVGGVGSALFHGANGSLASALDSGGGFTLFAGWRGNPYIAFEIDWMTTFHAPGPASTFPRGSSPAILLSAMTGDAKIFVIPSSRRIEPYIQVGGGLYFLDASNAPGDSLSGVGFEAGGGVDVRLNPVVSVGARALYRGAYLDNSQDQIVGYPYEAGFLNMTTFSAYLKISI